MILLFWQSARILKKLSVLVVGWRLGSIGRVIRLGGYLFVRGGWVLSLVVMSCTTIVKDDGKSSVQTRYFISSLPLGVKLIARAVWGHWMVESLRWCLDVLFCEDANRTVDRHGFII